MAENMTKPFPFSLFNHVDDTAILHNSTQNFRLQTFAVQLIFSILLHNHISNASVFLIPVLDNVEVSAAYKATLHARHLIICFLKSSHLNG